MINDNKIACYCRVSTEYQAHNGVSIQNQQQLLQQLR